MTTLRQAVQEYVRMRRDLGFKLHEAGKGLLDFVTFMEQHRASSITQALALAWAQQPANVQPAHWAQRLSFVRRSAQYRSATDSRTQIPAQGLLPYAQADRLAMVWENVNLPTYKNPHTTHPPPAISTIGTRRTRSSATWQLSARAAGTSPAAANRCAWTAKRYRPRSFACCRWPRPSAARSRPTMTRPRGRRLGK
jgi:hypothetical protein